MGMSLGLVMAPIAVYAGASAAAAGSQVMTGDDVDGPAVQTWKCEACAYDNPDVPQRGVVDRCELCETPRPQRRDPEADPEATGE